MIKTLRSFFSWQWISLVGSYGLFWSWNLIFLAFMLLGFAPIILVELFTAVRAGIVPLKFLFVSVGIISIPAVAVVLGATILRKYPRRLLALGYGVEGPLMLLLILRFFGLQELNPAMMTLYTIAFLGLAAFFWQVVKVDDEKYALSSQLRVIGTTLMLGLGLYACVMMAFYVLPLGVELFQAIPDMVRGIGRELSYLNFQDLTFMLFSTLIFLVLGGITWAYTATILLGMPIVVPILYWKGWRRAVAELSGKWSGAMTGVLVAVTVMVCAVAIFVTTCQPQIEAFALLETPPASVEEAEALLAQKETIRQGLTNAYLAPFRYASSMGGVDHISELYTWALDASEEQAASVQRAYEWLAQPMLYRPADSATVATAEVREADGRIRNPVIFQEAEKAAELYETFFDEPINSGEQAAVVAAARATWEVDRAEKAWQAVDNREVHMTRQEITVEEHGDWAEIELYEVYQNQTADQQEVVYYFSVPESAVMTGVWLGTSADRDKRFVYTVATRGAAQEVYRQEVVQRRDPALLEQIGPRQYRLRIFPIPERRVRWSERRANEIVEGEPMHMWLTWRVLAQDEGWALPVLAERRNIYWNDESTRLLNGTAFETDAETWMPSFAPIANRADPTAHRVDYAADKTIIARPLAADQAPQLSDQNRLALVLDRSYSMREEADAVAAELATLAADFPNVDLYLTASQVRGEPATRLPLSEFDPADLVYFGGQNAAELLTQFDEQRGQDDYDAVLVLTDGTGYELGEGDVVVPPTDEPLWMVHLGGFPLGYDDDTLEVIQASGGGVAATIGDALTRLAISQEESDDAVETRDLIDGYIWETLATADAADQIGHDSDGGFAAFGGRRLILAEMQKVRHQLDDVTILDELHAIAVENSIVTPYSSMIVLVNEQQRRLLEELEKQADRFDREHEDVGNTMPPAPTVTGVPEPEEWLLIMIAIALLGWYAYSNKLHLRKSHV